MMRVAGKVQGGVVSERWFEGLYIGMRLQDGELQDHVPPM